MKFAIRLGMTLAFIIVFPLLAIGIIVFVFWTGLEAIWKSPIKVAMATPIPVRPANPESQPIQPPPIVQESNTDYSKMAFGRLDKWGTG